jgi:tetratricopeptide (TPR) repeat protein
MYRDLFGERHPDIASSLVSVGYVHRKLGDFERALNYYQEGLNQYRELFGHQHQYIATTLSHIGELYRERGDYSQALEYMRSALSIRMKLLGERQPLTCETAANVASLLMTLNKRQEAYELVTNFLHKVPPDGPVYDYFKQLEAQLLSSTIRKGFRQPPKKGKKVQKKRR